MFKNKKSKFQLAQDEVQKTVNKANKRIELLGENTGDLYSNLIAIQERFDQIRKVPNDKKLQYEEFKKIRINWKQQSEKIEKEYDEAIAKDASAGAAGVGVGIAVVTLGPTVAMGAATTFGVASTGTAISTLSGAAATNAALAWLGGGTLVTGGGGMAAGEALLVLAGPIGLAIAGVSLLVSGLLFWKTKSNKKRIEDVFTLISRRDVKSYDLAIIELDERINRIKDETRKLGEALNSIITFGLSYDEMSEAQQFELGTYVNLMNSSTQLLVNPIKGLQPKYSIEEYENYIKWDSKIVDNKFCEKYKLSIISLANLLYKIELNDRDRKLLWISLRKNKKMLIPMKLSKRTFKFEVIDIVYDALDYLYMNNLR